MARLALARSVKPTWNGTIVWDIDPPQMSRFKMREGMNVKLRDHHGEDLVLQIVKVTMRDVHKGGRVTTQVSSAALDYPTLRAVLDRKRNAVDPAKTIYNKIRRGNVAVDRLVFDGESPAGRYVEHSVHDNLYDVIPVPVGSYGTFGKLVMRTFAPACGFAFGIFTKEVTHKQLWDVMGNILTTSLTEPPWNVYRDELLELGLIEGFGWKQQLLGYFPRQYSGPSGATAAPVTGRFEDTGALDFFAKDGERVWVALIAKESCKVRGRFYPQVSA